MANLGDLRPTAAVIVAPCKVRANRSPSFDGTKDPERSDRTFDAARLDAEQRSISIVHTGCLCICMDVLARAFPRTYEIFNG